MNIGRAAADQAGARPYLHRYGSSGVRIFRGQSTILAKPYRLRMKMKRESVSHSATPELLQLLNFRDGAGRDALPLDPRQEVRWLRSGAAPLIVYAFPARPA